MRPSVGASLAVLALTGKKQETFQDVPFAGQAPHSLMRARRPAWLVGQGNLQRNQVPESLQLHVHFVTLASMLLSLA